MDTNYNISDDYYSGMNENEMIKLFHLSEGVFLSDFKSPFDRKEVIITIYMFIFVIGYFLNAFVCFVIVYKKLTITTTSWYILNLSISDILLLTFGAPNEVYDYFNVFQLPNVDVGCYLRCWITESSTAVSTLTVMVFTMERYLAICHPFVVHVISDVSRFIKIIIVIWMVGLISSAPLAWKSRIVIYEPPGSVGITSGCLYDVSFTTIFMDISTAVFFILPMSIVIAMHMLMGIKLWRATKMRRTGTNESQVHNQAPDSTNRTLKLLVAIAVTFFVCWTPLRMQRWFSVHYTDWYNWFDEGYGYMEWLLFFSRILCLLSTIMNPVIYSIMSRKFRNACKDLSFTRDCCKRFRRKERNLCQ